MVAATEATCTSMLHLFIESVICFYSMFILDMLGGAKMNDGDNTKKPKQHIQLNLKTNACLILMWLDWRASVPSHRQAWKTSGSSRRETSNIRTESPVLPSLAVASSTLPWHHRPGDTAAIISILQLYLKPALIKISSWTAVKQKLLHKDLFFQHFLLDLC